MLRGRLEKFRKSFSNLQEIFLTDPLAYKCRRDNGCWDLWENEIRSGAHNCDVVLECERIVLRVDVDGLHTGAREVEVEGQGAVDDAELVRCEEKLVVAEHAVGSCQHVVAIED